MLTTTPEQRARLNSIGHAILTLIRDSEVRERFLRHDPVDLGVSAADREAFATIDPTELHGMARALRRTLYGTRGQGLKDVYRACFAHLERLERSSEDVIDAFASSAAYHRYRELPFGGQGLSIEEAFYLYLSVRPEFREITARHALDGEFLSVMLKALASCEVPSFLLEDERIRQAPGRAWAVLNDPQGRAAPWLFFAIRGKRYFEGAVAPVVPLLLDRATRMSFADCASSCARERGLEVAAVEKMLQQLIALELVERS
ncbi:MAG: hypothetical protein ABI895_34815 [Deltaproteobacteria bacterium]